MQCLQWNFILIWADSIAELNLFKLWPGVSIIILLAWMTTCYQLRHASWPASVKERSHITPSSLHCEVRILVCVPKWVRKFLIAIQDNLASAYRYSNIEYFTTKKTAITPRRHVDGHWWDQHSPGTATEAEAINTGVSYHVQSSSNLSTLIAEYTQSLRSATMETSCTTLAVALIQKLSRVNNGINVPTLHWSCHCWELCVHA